MGAASKALHSCRWNVYYNVWLSRKIERIEMRVSRFLSGCFQIHVLVDIHHVRLIGASTRTVSQLSSVRKMELEDERGGSHEVMVMGTSVNIPLDTKLSDEVCLIAVVVISDQAIRPSYKIVHFPSREDISMLNCCCGDILNTFLFILLYFVYFYLFTAL